MAMHKYWHVGANIQTEGGQPFEIVTEIPELIEAEQGGGGIVAAATQAAADGQALDQGDISALRTGRILLQASGGPEYQIVFIVQARGLSAGC